jgi:dTDP-4-dehydrorhamnose 3,5-epimerase
MQVAPAPLPGLFVVEAEPAVDDRGSFVRVWDQQTLHAAGLEGRIDQCNVSQNRTAGTLRGMHWQVAPHEEVKLVACVRGSVFDVVVDVRPASSTYLKWWGLELDAATARALYIPGGFAHGFITLTDDSDVLYLMTGDYQPASARGLRYDDPAVGIDWPIDVRTVSARDLAFPAVSR